VSDSPLPRLARLGALIATATTLTACPAPQRVPDPPAARVIERVEPKVQTDDPELGPRADLGGATMQIPRGWIPTSGPGLHWENAGGGDDRQPSAANMNVIVGDPKPLDQTWEAFWAELTDQYGARTEGIQDIVGKGRDDVGAFPAWHFEIRRREGGVEFALLQYIVGTPDQVYYLTFASRVDEFARYEPLYRRCIASFRVH
jgi:hypothetical protein